MKKYLTVLTIILGVALAACVHGADTTLSVDISGGKMTLLVNCKYGSEKCERVLYCIDSENKCTPDILTDANKMVENQGRNFLRYMGVGSDEVRGSIEFAEVTGNFYIVAKNSRQLPLPVKTEIATSSAQIVSTPVVKVDSIPTSAKMITKESVVGKGANIIKKTPVDVINTELAAKLKIALNKGTTKKIATKMVVIKPNNENTAHLLNILLAYRLLNK